jgi:hypothetical protein
MPKMPKKFEKLAQHIKSYFAQADAVTTAEIGKVYELLRILERARAM